MTVIHSHLVLHHHNLTHVGAHVRARHVHEPAPAADGDEIQGAPVSAANIAEVKAVNKKLRSKGGSFAMPGGSVHDHDSKPRASPGGFMYAGSGTVKTRASPGGF